MSSLYKPSRNYNTPTVKENTVLGSTYQPSVFKYTMPNFGAPQNALDPNRFRKFEDEYQEEENPYLKQFQKPYEETSSFQEQGYQTKDVSGALPEFEFLRKRLGESYRQQSQEAEDALQRRFAAMGALNSGAYQKQAELQAQRGRESYASQLEGLGVQEAQARRGLQQIEEERKFRSDEALKGRKFAADEASRGRKFAYDEAGRNRVFQSGEAAIGRKAAARESYNNRIFQSEQADLQRQYGKELAQYDMAYKVWATNLDQEAKIKQLDLLTAQMNVGIEQDALSYAMDAKYKRGDPRPLSEIQEEGRKLLRGDRFFTWGPTGSGGDNSTGEAIGGGLGAAQGLTLGGVPGALGGGLIGKAIGGLF